MTVTDAPEPSSTSISETHLSDIRVVAKGGVFQLFGLIVSQGLTFIFVAFVFRFLGPNTYGLYRQVERTLRIIGIAAPMGFNVAAMRAVAQSLTTGDREKAQVSSRIALVIVGVISGIAFIALFGLAPAIARAFADTADQVPLLTRLLRAGALFVPAFALTQVFVSCTKGYKTVVPYVVVHGIVFPSIMVALAIGLLLMGYGLVGIVLSLVVSAIVALVVAIWFYGRTTVSQQYELHWSRLKGMTREMMVFAVPQAGATLVDMGRLAPGIIILGILGSDTDVGFFSVALSLQVVATIFLSAILSIWAPVAADLCERGDTQRLRAIYQTANRWIASFSFIVIVYLLVEPGPILRILAGSEAVGAENLTSILAVGTLVSVLTGPCGMLIAMAGWPTINLITSLVVIVAYVAFGVMIVPEYGGLGMAVVHAGLIVGLNASRVILAWRLVGVHPFGPSYWKPIVAACGTSIVFVLLPLEEISSKVVTSAVYVLPLIVYSAVLLGFGTDPEDRVVYASIKRRLMVMRR